MRGAAIVLLACGCIESQLVPCGADLCPLGDVCTPAGCATPEAAAACTDQPDGAPCATDVIAPGTCFGGRCQPVACGNGLVEADEACDDGNVIAGDGCSSACNSLETCGNNIVDPATEEECDSGVPGQSSDGCSSRCFVEPELWREVVQNSITPRSRAAIAYDAYSFMLVFGGLGDSGILGDTWVWQGGWSRLDMVNDPPRRHSAAVAFDTTRGVVVLFGGFDENGPLADTWEWDGLVWTERVVTGPAPRGAAAATYDKARNQVMLFGGRGSAGELGDAWGWNGTSWQPITTATSPAARSEHTMAFADDSSNLVFLYGGGTGETWTYDGLDWTLVSSSQAVLPDGARLIWNEELSQIELLGIEFPQSEFLSVFSWTGATPWELQSQDQGAPARTHFGVTSDTSCGCVTLMLGTNPDATAFLDDVWEVDTSSGNQWSELDAAAESSPSPRTGHAIAFDTKRGRGVMIGGDGPGTYYGATWLWSRGRWAMAGANFISTEAVGHAMAYDNARDQVIAYDGTLTLAWDGVADWESLTPTTSPQARTEHAMVYDSARARIVMFGGFDTAPRSDTWEWDGFTWIERTFTMPPPQARERHSMAYDSARGRLVLFGGRDASESLGDTWEYDGTQWYDVTPSTPSPSPRFDHTMAYDPFRARVLLVGGDLYGTDTWEWNGSVWEARTPANPPPDRLGAAMFYDIVSHEMVLFGGLGSRYFGETYVRTFELAGQTDACGTQDSDGDALAGCADPDCAGQPMCL